MLSNNNNRSGLIACAVYLLLIFVAVAAVFFVKNKRGAANRIETVQESQNEDDSTKQETPGDAEMAEAGKEDSIFDKLSEEASLEGASQIEAQDDAASEKESNEPQMLCALDFVDDDLAQEDAALQKPLLDDYQEIRVSEHSETKKERKVIAPEYYDVMGTYYEKQERDWIRAYLSRAKVELPAENVTKMTTMSELWEKQSWLEFSDTWKAKYMPEIEETSGEKLESSKTENETDDKTAKNTSAE